MSTHGDRMRAIRRRVGQGLQGLPIAPDVKLKWSDFKGGYVSLVDEALVPPNASPFCIDVDVDDQGRIARMPGSVMLENLAPHNPREMAVHASLDAGNELLFFDPPHIGVKGDAETIWYDVGLPTGDNWVTCLHGGVLVFTNGRTSIYSREAQGTVVDDLAWGPARTLASFAGRVFAGHATIGGVENPLGLMWTGANDLLDTSGYGSGAELLLADTSQGDWIIALRTIGFDVMPIVLRKSIWVGIRTGNATRPVDFRPRIGLLGAVCESAVRSTKHGVVLLSDEGVELFDGNGLRHLSANIDQELLPLDYSRLHRYSMMYSHVKDTIELYTPTETWIYSFKYSRWLRSSARVSRAVSLFNPSTIEDTGLPAGWGTYWNGSWGSSIITQSSGGVEIGNSFMPDSWFPSSWYGFFGSSQGQDVGTLSDKVMLVDSIVAAEDRDATDYVGNSQTPIWTVPVSESEDLDRLYTIKKVDVQYVAEDEANLNLVMLDTAGNYEKEAEMELPASEVKRTQSCKLSSTGKGIGLRLEILDGFPQISKIALRAKPRGEEID